MRTKRSLAVAMTLATTLTATVLATTVQPAAAADNYIEVIDLQPCPAGYLCAHVDDGGQGTGVGFYLNAWNWGTIPSQYQFINNTASSIYNHGTGTYSQVRAFANAGGTGTNRCLKMGYAQQDLAFGTPLNNAISAHAWYTSCVSSPVFEHDVQYF